MNYIFIVNDYQLGNKEYKGKTIAEVLLKKEHWVFNQSSPNLKKIKPGDEAIIYIAGRDNRFFYANIKIAGEMKNTNIPPTSLTVQSLYKMFPIECPIEVLNIWEIPLYMVDIKDELDFITDKKNYGLFLRQSNRIIGLTDYSHIIKAAIEKNSV